MHNPEFRRTQIGLGCSFDAKCLFLVQREKVLRPRRAGVLLWKKLKLPSVHHTSEIHRVWAQVHRYLLTITFNTWHFGEYF